MIRRGSAARRRGHLIAGAVFAAIALSACVLWLRASAAALGDVGRGPERASARALAQGAWERVAATLVRGELPPASLPDLGRDGATVRVELPVREAERVAARIVVTVPGRPERLGVELRVRARRSAEGWEVVDWVEVGR